MGKENVPETLDLFQDMKYTEPEKIKSLKAKYRENSGLLEEQLSYVMPNGEKGFIPTNSIIKNAKTIAGAGSKTELRVEQRLVDTYGGKLGNWKKRVGKVESSKYVFDVHWYERDGKQYEMKLKHRSEKKT